MIFNKRFFQYIRIQDQTQSNTQLLESKFADIQNSSYPINNKSPIFYSTSSSSSSSSYSSKLLLIHLVSSSSHSHAHVLPHPSFHPRRISVGNFTPEHAFSRQHDQKHRLLSRYFIFLDIVQGHHPSIVPPLYITLLSGADSAFLLSSCHPPYPSSSSLLLSSWINRILEFLFSIRELE